ncbi:MAG: acyltransferase, partial [Clostridia bacterium]|nr:acyltransferase [Clostridia bacterium]
LIAMVLVVTVHATSFNGWANTKTDMTWVNFWASMGRFLSFACVPLFVVLSGYLCHKKTPSFDYYKKLFRFLLEFAICSVVIGLFKIKYMGMSYDLVSFWDDLTTFKLAPYAWYVNMYIGLFLFIPFLNMLYQNIPSFRTKLLFVGLLILVLILPNTTTYCTWSYWSGFYILGYYFVGCFLCDLPKKLWGWWWAPVGVLTLLAETLICMFGVEYVTVESHSNLFCLIVTVCIVLTFGGLTAKTKNGWTKVLRALSDTSLSFFLVSFIFDEIARREVYVEKGLFTFYERQPHLFYIVPLTILGSLVLGLFTHLLTRWLAWGCLIAQKQIVGLFAKEKS